MKTHITSAISRLPFVLIGIAALASFTSVQAEDLYASRPINGDVLKIRPDGTQASFASTGSGGTTGSPRGLAFDSSGNLYVAERDALGDLENNPNGRPKPLR